ncbi:MAG: right-handed parallel beta-helix repeat-containing protein [Candidatus Aenigmatarchaeota archaeon]
MRYLILLFILIFIPIVFSINCVLRSNSCNSGEFCLFSRYQQDNSHVGDCNAYSLLTCCSDPYLEKVEVKSSCELGENGTISMFNYINAHAEIYTAGNYDYKVCVSCPWFCNLRASCLADEYNLASLNASTNAHIASPNYYGLQVCCKREDVAPSVSNIGQNSSSIQPGQAIKLYAFWEDNGNLSYAILETNETGTWQNKSIYGSPFAIKANSGWSNFTWQNSSISNRVVGWRIYANDSCGNWYVTNVNTFEIEVGALSQCQNITSSGTYVLQNDVSAPGYCFNITANNVELDCNGKNIIYAQSIAGIGVYADKVNNVTVKNCNITGGGYDYAYGVYLNYANFTEINNNTIYTYGAYGHGIYVYYSLKNNISSNNITHNNILSYGIYLFSSSNNTIELNYVKTSASITRNLYLREYSNFNVIKNNIIQNDGSTSFTLESSSNNTINNNTINVFAGTGLHLSSSLNNTIENNSIFADGFYGRGIGLLGGSNYNTITKNNIKSGGTYHAFRIDQSTNNNISINNITTFGPYRGFDISSGHFNILFMNNITTVDNNADGIYVTSSNNLTIKMNNISTNGNNAEGLYLSSSSNASVMDNDFYTLMSYAIIVDGTSQNHYDHYINDNKEYTKNIYYFYNASNIEIKDEEVGEVFLAYCNSSKIHNLTFNKDGILLVNTNHSNISSSKINIGGYGIYGIYLLYGKNNTIKENNITTTNSYADGIYIQASLNNTIKENNITTTNSYADGIYIQASNYTTIDKNIIKTTSLGNGIYLEKNNNNTLSINNITTTGTNAEVIYMLYSTNNTILMNNITSIGSGAKGFYIDSSSNNNFINNLVKSNSYSFYIYTNSFNLTIINTTIQTNADNIRFRQNSSIQLINSTFNKSKIFWEPTAVNAWINVSYYVDVLVRNFTDPISLAQVNITNYTNNLIFSDFTNSDGYVTAQILQEYFANGTYVYLCPSSQANLTCAGPYNFSASKENLFNSTIENINQSKTVEIILFEKILTMMLSEKLTEGIFYTSINGSLNNTQLPIEVDKWNNATWNFNNTPEPGDKKTLYWIYNSGNIDQDFCIKANEDLKCNEGSCIGNTIPIMNVAFTNSTENDEQNPSFSDQNRLSTSFVKIARDVQPGEYRYFRFWLYGNLTGKPSGIYNTTYTVRNVESGGAC